MTKFLDTSDEQVLGIGICDRCKFKFPLLELKLDPNTQLRVCENDLDDYDPYREAPRNPDRTDLPFYRPDRRMPFDEDG